MGHGRVIPPETQRIIIRLSHILTKDDISVYTGVSLRSVERILAYFQKHGTIREPKARETKQRGLAKDDVEILLNTINEAPDLYLDELQEILSMECGQQVSRGTIWKTLTRAGFTMKKITKVAAERSIAQRREYLERISKYEAHQLVFVDESAVDRRTSYRGRAWSYSGTKAQRKAFFMRGKRYSVLPALSLNNGIIHCKIRQGSFKSDSFKDFILGLLDQMNPFPESNSVIVMDNCKIHKREDILEAINARGVAYEFLPPYSPDYNPIELAFSAMKYHLRRDGAYVRMAMASMSEAEVVSTFMRALYVITPQDCQGWYRHCGYID